MVKDAGAELTAVELALDMGSEYMPLAPARAVSQMRSDLDLAREERNEWRNSHDKLTARVEELQAENTLLRESFPWGRARAALDDMERMRHIADDEIVHCEWSETVARRFSIVVTAGALRRIMGR